MQSCRPSAFTFICKIIHLVTARWWTPDLGSEGNNYTLVATELIVSIDTVRTHIKKIYEKLPVHSHTEAVAKAMKEKLV